ncbi:MAG: DUF2089 domain-containing protein [Anaerolineae bacterium]|nr:DUF2089 domain-containing protein [Anaerolineae bacterium]
MYPVYPVPGQCPVCGEAMTIAELKCDNCDISLKGRFSFGRLALLTPEQLEFVEVFLRCEGKLKAVGKLLSVSYPTVRSRLDEVIMAMGYELPGSADGDDDAPLTPGDRAQVLDNLAEGRITSEEALKLLQRD